jgi:hypothetical protein
VRAGEERMAPTCLSFYAIGSPKLRLMHGAGHTVSSKRIELKSSILFHPGKFLGRRLMRSRYDGVRSFERAHYSRISLRGCSYTVCWISSAIRWSKRHAPGGFGHRVSSMRSRKTSCRWRCRCRLPLFELHF